MALLPSKHYHKPRNGTLRTRGLQELYDSVGIGELPPETLLRIHTTLGHLGDLAQTSLIKFPLTIGGLFSHSLQLLHSCVGFSQVMHGL